MAVAQVYYKVSWTTDKVIMEHMLLEGIRLGDGGHYTAFIKATFFKNFQKEYPAVEVEQYPFLGRQPIV